MARRSTQKPKATDKGQAGNDAASTAANAVTANPGTVQDTTAAGTGASAEETSKPEAEETKANTSDDTGGTAGKDTEGASDAGKPAKPHVAPAQDTQEQPGGGDDGHALAPAGDQDQAEAATAAIIAGSGETTSQPEETDPAAGLVVRITGPKKGRWRIGRRFDRTPVEIPVSEITEDQAEALRADNTLTIEVVPTS